MLRQIVPFQDKLYYCAVDFPLTSLYLNSLLANLNTREYVRAGPGDDGYNTYPMEERSRGTQVESLHSSRVANKKTGNGQVNRAFMCTPVAAERYGVRFESMASGFTPHRRLLQPCTETQRLRLLWSR